MTRFYLTTLTLLAVAISPALAAKPSTSKTLADADEVLADLSDIKLKGIPPALLADAEGIAIIPHVIKAGLVVAGRGGHGVVLVKDGKGGWGDPTFVNFGGGSVGFQVGVEKTDVVLVFRKRESLNRVLDGKKKLTLGADASIAAGPVGREAAAATDAKLEAEIISYSRSKGLFAGVSLDGSALGADNDETTRFREKPTKDEIKLLEGLLTRLTQMSGPPPEPKGVPVPVAPPTVILPQPVPGTVPPPPALPPMTMPPPVAPPVRR